MTRHTLIAGLAVIATITAIPTAAPVASATDAASKPASQPATTSAPADNTLAPAVAAILDRLEKRGDLIDSIEARIEYVKIDPVLDDKQEYKGLLRFKKLEPNPRFFIQFDSFRHEGIVKQTKQWHVFDGQWYIEARESTKTIVRNEIVRPGETVEAFKVGKGPFPLPFGQKKVDIVKHFTVKLVAPTAKDPPNCDHLQCTPRPDTEMAGRYDTVDFFIDRKLDLPVRVETTEKQEGNRILASFEDVKVNSGIVESQLNLPELKDYQIDTHPLREPSALAPPPNDSDSK